MVATRSKLERLRSIVRSMDSAAVAFSGGSDSSLVAKIAEEELGERAIAITIDSPMFPGKELRDARRVAKAIGIRHEVVAVDLLADRAFSDNPPDRCYACKLAGLGEVARTAREHSLAYVLDGSNADDSKAYRPGSRARDELAVRSPLAEAGLGKEDVVRVSRTLGLPTHDREPSPCLATRVPYGERLTPELLDRIEKAERYLSGRGFLQVRVRAHGPIARVEVAKAQVRRLAGPDERTSLVRRLKKLGFAYVTVDLEGYRSGSMDEVLGR